MRGSMKWGINHFFRNLYRIGPRQGGYYHRFNETSTIVASYPTIMFLKASIAGTVFGLFVTSRIESNSDIQEEENEPFFLKFLSNTGQVSAIGLLTILNCRKSFAPKYMLRIHDAILARPLEYHSVFHKMGGSIGLNITLQYYLFFETLLTCHIVVKENIPLEKFLDIWVDNMSVDMIRMLPLIGLGYVGGRMIGVKAGEKASLFTTALLARGVEANTAATRYLHTAFSTQSIDVAFLLHPVKTRILALFGVVLSFAPQLYLVVRRQKEYLIVGPEEREAIKENLNGFDADMGNESYDI